MMHYIGMTCKFKYYKVLPYIDLFIFSNIGYRDWLIYKMSPHMPLNRPNLEYGGIGVRVRRWYVIDDKVINNFFFMNVFLDGVLLME